MAALLIVYGNGTAMPLATVNGDKANICVVNAYYKENVFYITTYALSNKMKEILENLNVALNNNLFVAHGIGKNIGNPLDEPNRGLREELKRVFAAIYDKHVNKNFFRH